MPAQLVPASCGSVLLGAPGRLDEALPIVHSKNRIARLAFVGGIRCPSPS